MADPLNHLCHYYYTSNLDIIPHYAYPHTVVIYYEDDGGFVFRGFGERNWDSVTSLEILSNRALSARPYTSGLGPAISYVLTHAPNIHMLSVDIEHVNLPGMVILNRILGIRAEMFTVLDLGTAPMCDVSNLVLPSLKTLAVDCSRRVGVHWLPTFDAKRLVSLELNNTSHDVFLHVLQRAAGDGVVVFSQLDALVVGFGEHSNGTILPDYKTAGLQCSFPRLTNLTIRTLCSYHPDLHWMFRDAPLETLHLVGDTKFINKLDVSCYPNLYSVTAEWDQRGMLPSRVAVESRLLAPVSSIQKLHVALPSLQTLRSLQFGCRDIRSLVLSFTIPNENLQALLHQLPYLVSLNMRYTLTAKAHEDSQGYNQVNLRSIWHHVRCQWPAPISTSLQTLVIDDDKRPPHTDEYSPAFIPLIGTIARVPSLLKLILPNCPLHDDGILIPKTLNDTRIGSLATHFANVEVVFAEFYNS
ncbi:hypothetical protein DL89DRAFT_268880 [Linderina pennispora]|uniref:RNI-like protein n=1 Tax=Linderina pennispora TaxID=61395 RepID=A0A1Y1W574_9FUNG|nr:uncharacterized protein DL89DRAFT_268880 [Linderina pennispora]ORX68364.1 hypothetical protein DL89DRAFT_268880 [Linderina pennispora]